MNNLSIVFENKFEVAAPSNWHREEGPENHLTLGKSAEEMIIIRRDDVRLFGLMNLVEYMDLLRENAGRLRHASRMEISSVEPFNTPRYVGKIMTYAFFLDGRAAETTLFAFKTELFFYILMLQAPVDCSHETLSEFFDVVNSFRIIDEKVEQSKADVKDMKFKMEYDIHREICISVPENWISNIDSYFTETDYLIFVSSGDRNQAVGISKTEYPEMVYGSEYATVEIGGMKALQHEDEGTPQSVLLKFLNTVVEADGVFYLISCWTPPAFYDEYAELFRFVTRSFSLCRGRGINSQLH